MLLRRALTVSLLMLSLFAPSAATAQLERPKPKGWVNDFANVISSKAKKRLTALCVEVDEKTHAQIAVVTIDSTGSTSIDDYATSLFNRWGIGHKGENRGIMIILAISDRKYRIEVGRGFETLFPNERVVGIGAEMVPDLKQQHYSEALLHTTDEIAHIIAKDRGVTLSTVGSESSAP